MAGARGRSGGSGTSTGPGATGAPAAPGAVVLEAGGGPPSAQVHDQLLAQVQAGLLAPGDRLPTVRALAERLGVSAGTVAKAYRRLEAAGVTSTATRAGTVVRDRDDPGEAGIGGDGVARGVDGVTAAAAALARAAALAGADDDAAHAALAAALVRARQR